MRNLKLILVSAIAALDASCFTVSLAPPSGIIGEPVIKAEMIEPVESPDPVVINPNTEPKG